MLLLTVWLIADWVTKVEVDEPACVVVDGNEPGWCETRETAWPSFLPCTRSIQCLVMTLFSPSSLELCPSKTVCRAFPNLLLCNLLLHNGAQTPDLSTHLSVWVSHYRSNATHRKYIVLTFLLNPGKSSFGRFGDTKGVSSFGMPFISPGRLMLRLCHWAIQCSPSSHTVCDILDVTA